MDENKKRNILEGREVMENRDEVPIPPPPGFVSPFKSIQEWLFDICNKDLPLKPISEYCFLLFESPSNDHIICLAGYNTYNGQGFTTTQLDFKPINMFFSLPKNEYQYLPSEEVRKKVLDEIIEFTRNTKFQKSFFSKAESITTNFSGKIWPG